MRPAQVLPHEVRELTERLPCWLGPFTNWSARFALRGPRWMPMPVRKVPLHLACFTVKLYVKGVL